MSGVARDVYGQGPDVGSTAVLREKNPDLVAPGTLRLLTCLLQAAKSCVFPLPFQQL